MAALAVAKLGGIFIPSSIQFQAAEIQYRLNDSQAVAVITTHRLLAAIEECRAGCPQLRHVIGKGLLLRSRGITCCSA